VDLLINKYAGAYGVDPALVRAVMRNESGFNPMAVSPKGAQGLMQLMPGTAALMGVQNPFDPEQNIAGGVGYLRQCLDRFGHNVPLAVAAYNAGPDAVARYCTIPPYQETQLFVNNVMGTYGFWGPNQAPYNASGKGVATPPGNVKAGPPGMRKITRETARAAQEQDRDAPHRPKAKIIEVRSHKVQTRAISVLKD
jgi:membrane-bound lytic murein transglycosylase MltF